MERRPEAVPVDVPEWRRGKHGRSRHRSDSIQRLAPIEVFPGELTRHEIAASRDRIVIEGALKPGEAELYEGGELQLFELRPYESERDLANREPIAEQAVQDQFRFELDLAGQEGRTRLQSKFAVAAMLPDGSLELVDRAKYVSNTEILAPNTYPFPVAKSKKGRRCRWSAMRRTSASVMRR